MKTIYRKRIKKTRYGLSNGICFVGIHIGKHSWYVGKPNAKRIQQVSLESIKDDRGFTSVTTIHKSCFIGE